MGETHMNEVEFTLLLNKSSKTICLYACRRCWHRRDAAFAWSVTWRQVMRRDNGEAQLSIIGKGTKEREVLMPAAVAGPLPASRGDRAPSAPEFERCNCDHALTGRAVNYIVKTAAERASVNPEPPCVCCVTPRESCH
jgi:hypothetical protein